MAAAAYLEASGSGSYRARNLSRYRVLLNPIYEDVGRSGRDSFISESSFTYHTLPRLLFATSLTSSVYEFAPRPAYGGAKDAVARVQEGTVLLAYDEDEAYSHIKVDTELASKSLTKPWVPACPTNCFTIFTPKGAFASFKDLYGHNLETTKDTSGRSDSRKAFARTLEDVASSQLRFDYIACVACGTCGAIGPPEMVTFDNEREGHGVRYRFG
jgi:electron transfer flavoprotein-quinone oxidoreductase